MNLSEIIGQYDFNSKNVIAESYDVGHINSTLLLTCKDGNGGKYILQHINDRLFNVKELMHNIMLVTEFIRNKTAERGGDPDKECLTVIKTKDGRPYVKVSDGYYRIYKFINGISYQVVEKPEDFKKCAQAFGTFANLLAEFDAKQLYEVIPKFHDTENRFSNFINSVENNESWRAKNVQKEIDFVLKRSGYCGRITALLKNGEIPIRVTHNDTKLNNVLFDKETDKCIAVVDLDTVMPGSLCYDFGDAIRFGCNTSTEDDTDLSRVHFDIELFRAFAEGYLAEIDNGITQTEKNNLAFSAILMTYECGMRFLADYIDGDKYFRTSRESHNLDRARTQFKLVSEMETLLPEMEKIIENIK